MNSLVAMAVILNVQPYVYPDYIQSYYAHAIYQFAGTLFGQVMIANIQYFRLIANKMCDIYKCTSDEGCK